MAIRVEPGRTIDSDPLLKQMEAYGLAVRHAADGAQILDANPSKSGIVRVLVRGPDGQPLRSAPVEVGPTLLEDFHTALRLSARTGPDGRFSVPLPIGVQALRVAAPGVGLGATGVFELRAGATLDVNLPSLAAFATVEGSVDPTVGSVDGRVQCKYVSAYYGEATTDHHGHFIVHDLPPGGCGFYFRSADGMESASGGADLQAGQTAHVVLRHEDYEPRHSDDGSQGPAGAGSELPRELVTGTVCDASGRPLRGVTITAFLGASGTPVSSTSDAAGRYAIHNEESGTRACFMVARSAGHATRIIPRLFNPAPGVPPPVMDWVLPGAGGSLEMRVLQGGKPAAGIAVSPRLSDIWHLSGLHAQDGAPQVQQALIPPQTTDASGVARFTDLSAGSYDIVIPYHPWSARSDRGITGIRVADGRITRISINNFDMSANAPIRFLSAEGHRLFLTQVQRWQPATWTGSGEGRTLLDSTTGLFHQPLDRPGLMPLYYFFRDTPLKGNAALVTEPFYEGTATVAASELLPRRKPIDITVIHHKPGSLRVQMLGLDGQPARGIILVPGPAGGFGLGGTSDAAGRVVFDDLPPGVYPVYGQIAAVHPAPTMDLLQDDLILTGVTIVPVATVRIVADQQCRLVMRAQPVGYVRGTIVPPRGHAAEEYGFFRRVVDPRFLNDDGSPCVSLGRTDVVTDEKTGRFVVGPLPVGREPFTLYCIGPKADALRAAGTQAVEIRAGQVTHVDLHPVETTATSPVIGPPMFGALDFNRESPARITVVADDGKTPVAGARVEVFLPSMWWPYLAGISDSIGRAFISGGSFGGSEPKFQPAGSPKEPVVVAWLPGSCGAAVAPISPSSGEIRLVLPAPASSRGRVTVGGKSPAPLNAVIHVLAAHEHSGKLERAMDIETTCSADGTFELPGLTPGKYRVQAALDDVWLSRTANIEVGGGAAPGPIALDIDPPGVGVSIRLLGFTPSLRPSPRVAIERPPGPLTERLWPGGFEPDGAGVVYLEGLEAGTHSLILSGGRRQSFCVPQSDAQHQLPIEVDVHLSGGK